MYGFKLHLQLHIADASLHLLVSNKRRPTPIQNKVYTILYNHINCLHYSWETIVLREAFHQGQCF